MMHVQKNRTNHANSDEHATTINKWSKSLEGNLVHNLSNWQTSMYKEVQEALYKMSRLPQDHDLHLSSPTTKRAADVLAIIQANTYLEAPRLMNEEGDTVLFSWLENNLKKYLCVDEEEIEIELRKLGGRQHFSETVMSDGDLEIEKILQAIGKFEKNTSKE